MVKEIWKDVVDYEGMYEVSNLGRVKSLKYVKRRILKLGLDNYGYKKVDLYNNKKAATKTIHKLVAAAFLNHVPCGMKLVIDHIDNDKLKNNVNNLQIITHRLNASKDKNGVSVFTGVNWCKLSKKWRAQIQIGKKKKYLGLFTCELLASQTYQKALKKITE